MRSVLYVRETLICRVFVTEHVSFELIFMRIMLDRWEQKIIFPDNAKLGTKNKMIKYFLYRNTRTDVGAITTSHMWICLVYDFTPFS